MFYGIVASRSVFSAGASFLLSLGVTSPGGFGFRGFFLRGSMILTAEQAMRSVLRFVATVPSSLEVAADMAKAARQAPPYFWLGADAEQHGRD
jgi:hypothetical protein